MCPCHAERCTELTLDLCVIYMRSAHVLLIDCRHYNNCVPCDKLLLKPAEHLLTLNLVFDYNLRQALTTKSLPLKTRVTIIVVEVVVSIIIMIIIIIIILLAPQEVHLILIILLSLSVVFAVKLRKAKRWKLNNYRI